MARLTRRRKTWLLLLVLFAMVNLPLLAGLWQDRQLDQEGVEVTAAVVEPEPGDEVDSAPYVLGLRVPPSAGWEDRDGLRVRVDGPTYDAAVADRTVRITVLEDRPGVYELDGEVKGHAALITVLVADAFLLVILLLALRYAGRSRPLPVRISAVADVERCPPGSVWEELGDGTWLARGEVVGLADDELVLDVGEREVVVVLDGFANPVGWQQPAQVRGRLLE